MTKALLLVAISLIATLSFGQPRIDNVERISGYPFTTVLITGIGFSATQSDLQVWFGSVQGAIVTSSSSSITATVPASARLSSVEVIHLPTMRSAKSTKKFIPSYNGSSFSETSFSVTQFLNNGDPIFDMCSCDFDGDGKPDLAGSRRLDTQSNIRMLKNTSTIAGNNTTVNFVQSNVTIPFPTLNVMCGDLNGDGFPDLVATRGGSSTGNSIFIFQNNGAGGFPSFVQINTNVGDFTNRIAIHDLNGDGRPEIVVTSNKNILYIFENKLTTSTIVVGEFNRVDRTLTDVELVGGTGAVKLADMTGDGWPEIILTPNQTGQKVFILTNPANGTLFFPAIDKFGSGFSNIQDIAIADFNHDNILDIVVSDQGNNKAFVFLNKGVIPLLFQSVNSTTGFAAPKANGVDIADMNGDGFVDFVIANRKFTPGTEEIDIFISDGAATPNFTRKVITNGTMKGSWFVQAADFDGDSKPDIAVTSTNNGSNFSIDVWKNNNCHQALILNEDPLSICNPQTITLKALPLQGLAFSWNHAVTGLTTGPTRDITIADIGTMTLTAVGEGGACSTQDVLTISNGGGSVPATPTITAPNAACAGNSITVSTSVTADEYEWSGPNNFSSSVQNPPAITNVTTANAGIYRLRIKLTGCYSDFAEKQIDVVAPTSFSINSSTGNVGACSGLPVTLSVNNVAGYDYQWKKNGSNVGTNSASYPIASAAESDQADYTVFISNQTITCTSTTEIFTLNVFTAPVASFSRTPNLVCVGTEVKFDATGSTIDNTAPSVSYAWVFDDGGTDTVTPAFHTYAVADPSVSPSLTIGYSGITGCSNTSTPAGFPVNDATQPAITVAPVVTEICGDGTESVTMSVTGTFDTYTWSTSATGSSISVSQPGTYSVTTTDPNGCIGNADPVILTSKAGCEAGAAAIPKVFTPDGKGPIETETWIIKGVPNIDACTMSVFDGRGRRIYEVKGFPQSGWDGTANGKAVPDGTYYYVLGCPGAKPVTGTVLIVR